MSAKTKKPATKLIPAKSSRRLWGLRPLDIVVIVLATVLVAFGLWTTYIKKPASTGPCTTPGQQHTVIAKDDAFNLTEITAKQCDTLRIVNLDGTLDYQLAFGVHEQHTIYPGFTEQLIRPNEFVVVDLLTAGGYRIHDHLRDKAAVEIIIEAK